MKGMALWRHPEPSLIDKAAVTDPQLQIRGIWKKLDVASGAKPGGRLGFANWIWRSKLYIAGGQYGQAAYHRDMWSVLTSRIENEPSSRIL